MVEGKTYIPDRGDVVWLDYNQRRRPALTVSYREYNERVGLGLFCPITSTVKGYPFEVAVAGKIVNGCVLSDQVKNLDWSVRNVEYIERIENRELEEAIANITLLIRK